MAQNEEYEVAVEAHAADDQPATTERRTFPTLEDAKAFAWSRVTITRIDRTTVALGRRRNGGS